MQLFTYGSLMFPAVWQRVVGRLHNATPAVLHGYSRWCVKGEPYPGLLPDSQGDVDGMLYQGVTAAELKALDQFEGGQYERIGVVCHTEDGQVDAEVYAFRPDYYHQLTRRPWQPALFQRQGMKQFLAAYPGFKSLS